jgi:hypothetical protein
VAFYQFMSIKHVTLKLNIEGASFRTFTIVTFQVEVFCVVLPCSVVVGYQEPRRLRLEILKMMFAPTVRIGSRLPDKDLNNHE